LRRRDACATCGRDSETVEHHPQIEDQAGEQDDRQGRPGGVELQRRELRGAA
jgi:hypothetical protein